MDRMKLVWFVVGMLFGVGALLGASFKGQEPGKLQENPRFQVVEVHMNYGGVSMPTTLLLDNRTGRVCSWNKGKTEAGTLYDYWQPINTAAEEMESQEKQKQGAKPK